MLSVCIMPVNNRRGLKEATCNGNLEIIESVVK